MKKKTAKLFMTAPKVDDNLDKWKAEIKPMIEKQNTSGEESEEEQENIIENVGEDETDSDQNHEQGDSREDLMGGVEGESTISTEDRTTISKISAFPPSSNTSQTPRSGRKTTRAAKAKPPRRSHHNSNK